MKLRIGIVTTLLLAGGCVPQPQQPVEREPMPVQVQARPVPLPAPRQDWRDMPLSPGNWYYSVQPGGSQALFGPANSEAAFILRCDRGRRQVTLSREGVTSGNVMTIRTTSTARNYPLSVQTDPLNYVFGTTPATDRFLDEIAFSRGRISVEVPGMPMLVLPTWPEPARVVEDCRG